MDLLEELLAERNIRKALVQYVQFTDDINAEGWVNMFTPDGAVVCGAKRLQGHAELRDWITKMHSGRKMRHMMSNINITVESPTTASVTVDMSLLRADGTKWTLAALPRYTDKMVNTDNGWKFKERILDPREL